MSDDIVPLEDQLESVMLRHGSWENYKEAFLKLPERQRAIELAIFDRALDDEPARPTKTFASHWRCRRELAHLDAVLRNAKR
jgi:hypothetical protein